MREHTTDEIEKSLLECAEGRSCNGCIEISKSCEMGCIDCIISLKRVFANRLEAQQKEIAELKKKLAETYTVEQYLKDFSRLIDDAYGLENSSEKVREWATQDSESIPHPEKPKVTNGDKAKEIFGKEFHPCNICENAGKKCDDLKECGFDFYEWWNTEYKEPKNG